jgi:hypothetical protein
MKPIWGLFLAKEKRPLKTVPKGMEASIPLTYQPMDPLCKQLTEFLLKPLHHCSLLKSLSNPNLQVFSTFLRGLNIWKSHGDRVGLYRGRSNTFQCMECSMSWTMQPTRGHVLFCNTMTPLVSMQGHFLLTVAWKSQRVLQQHYVLTVMSGSISVSEWQLTGPVWTDSVHGTLTFNHVTVFPFIPTCLFCCTACGWLPASNAHNHVITCDQLLTILNTDYINLHLASNQDFLLLFVI